MTRTRHSLFYILMLGAMTALPPLSTDIGLPALASIAGDLRVDAALPAQTLSLFILGFALGPLLFGPLSDRIGRRPIMLGGLTVFTLAGVGCTLAPDIHTLLVSRFIQGCAAGAAGVLPVAIVRDTLDGPDARRLQSNLAMLNSLAPMAAPLLGSLVLLVLDWRGVYGCLVLAGLGLIAAALGGYRETLRRQHSEPPAGLLRSYALALRDRRFIVATALLALNFGGMFAYITSSPLVFMNVLGLSSGVYACVFALTAFGTLIGSWSNARLASRHIPEARILGVALSVSLGLSVLLLALVLAGHASAAVIAALVIGSNICTGFIMPNATHAALEGLARAAGTGAALMRSTQMLAGGLASLLVGVLYDGHSALAMAGVMSGCAALAGLCLVCGRRAIAAAPLAVV